MGYYNDDVAGLFTGDDKRRRRTTGDVAGTFDRRRRKDDDVLGDFDENFKVPVKAFIDGEDFCRAVRRCLINDLVAAAQDDDDDKKKKRHRR